MQINYKGKRVVVTGAAGFIGHHVVDRLVRGGARVKALVKYGSQSSIGLLSRLDRDVLDSVEVIFGDIRDHSVTHRLVANSDTVFHLAALIGIPYSYVAPGEYISVNTVGTLNILDAVRSHDVRRLVVTSTSETYGSAQYVPMDERHPAEAQSPYAASKTAADQLALSYFRSFQTPVAIIRPFNTFGPGQSLRAVIPTILTQMLHEQTEIRIGSLWPVRDFTYVTDTADAFMRIGCASKIEGEVFNIASGKGYTVEKIIQIAKRLTGYTGKVRLEIHRKRPEASEVTRLIGHAEKAASRLGWKPTVSLEEGLTRVIASIQNAPRSSRSSKYAI